MHTYTHTHMYVFMYVCVNTADPIHSFFPLLIVLRITYGDPTSCQWCYVFGMKISEFSTIFPNLRRHKFS